MEGNIVQNEIKQLIKGSRIFLEGELVNGVAFLSKGRVLIYNNGSKILVNSGVFLGISDLYSGKYQSTYIAADDALLHIFTISHTEELEQVLSLHKDYHGIMVASNNRLIFQLDQIRQNMQKHWSELYQFLDKSYQEYLKLAAQKGYVTKATDRFSFLHMPEHDLELLADRIVYYKETREIPLEVMKAFYSCSSILTLFQLEEQAEIINQQMDLLKEQATGYLTMARCLMDETDTCLFRIAGDLAIEVEKADNNGCDFMKIMDGIVEKINEAENFVDQMLGIKFTADRKSMGDIYNTLLTAAQGKKAEKETETKEQADNPLNNLNNAFQTILEYAGIDGDKAEEMKETMLAFINLSDRLDTQDTTRALRKKLANNHYEIYKAIFLKAYQNKGLPKVIDLFLKYGFVDERLLTQGQLKSLYYLQEEQKESMDCGLCQVYNIKEWLTLIYEGKKNPSKSEFDQDYYEMIQSLKKQGRLTPEEAKQWEKDTERKLDYEIQNLLRYNNRTVNGQMSVFVPFLHKDMMGDDLERIYLTGKKINDVIKELLSVDFSIFDREALYMNEEKRIVKEYIIKKVYPDIILMPTVGSNGIMWQEIDGKKRDTSGRFLFPAFSEMSLDTSIVRMFGRFRWEMCRSVEGVLWNDIKHKCLTSEYSDYIQFYRKNKELSEEKKERIKKQIQKARNNSREIFVIDYEQWVSGEVRGAIKLNKQVREIMATYCPFTKEIREKLKLQPLFAEAMARYDREKQKKIREIESRYRRLEQEKIEITQELADTLAYYKVQ